MKYKFEKHENRITMTRNAHIATHILHNNANVLSQRKYRITTQISHQVDMFTAPVNHCDSYGQRARRAASESSIARSIV